MRQFWSFERFLGPGKLSCPLAMGHAPAQLQILVHKIVPGPGQAQRAGQFLTGTRLGRMLALQSVWYTGFWRVAVAFWFAGSRVTRPTLGIKVCSLTHFREVTGRQRPVFS